MAAAKRTSGKPLEKPIDGQKRVVIEHVSPEIDAGRFAAKRVEGETVEVQADIFGDGHDHIEARLLFRVVGKKGWAEAAMLPLGNDRWHGTFAVPAPGSYEYTIAASIDHFDTWQDGLRKKWNAGQAVALELRTGALLVAAAAERAEAAAKTRKGKKEKEARVLRGSAALLVQNAAALARLEAADAPLTERVALVEVALGAELLAQVSQFPDVALETCYERVLRVDVDRKAARYSAWYELFPRSQGPDASTHGTLRDVESKLPYLQALGFDVLYMPPIHPIGRSFRKGKNNSVTAQPGEVGSPWAIGAKEGGHTAVLPELGTLADFDHLLAASAAHGLELAMDIAFQCAPDHPWVKAHPEWFKHRADGSIQYAENPPKKYQDIYPIDFESQDWEALWDALAGVFLFWVERGVRIFRVDNPHTKAFPFWEWCIAEVKRQYPDALFLAEAFTRPRVMERLAKVGFSQSYTYFCWRTTGEELTTYLTELTRSEQWQYFRPNFWPNTPDILPLNLQTGGQGAFALRLVLAATLNPSYGVYGGAYETLDDTPFRVGGEEYFDSEKYEVKHWELSLQNPIAQLMRALNTARRAHPAFHSLDTSLQFHAVDNPQLLVYSKRSPDGLDVVLTVVNLDPLQPQAGWIYLDTQQLGLMDSSSYVVEDLLTGSRYAWSGASNYVALDPKDQPAHVFAVHG